MTDNSYYLNVETGIKNSGSTFKRNYQLSIIHSSDKGMLVSMWASSITPSGMKTSRDEVKLMENKLVSFDLMEINKVMARTALRLDPLIKRQDESCRILAQKLKEIKDQKVKVEIL